MASEKGIDRQIVLHTTKFSETSVVVHCFSREWGRKGFMMHGAGKAASRILPLTVNEAEVSRGVKSQMPLIRNLTPVYPLSGLRGSIFKNSITMFVAEVLFKVLPDEIPDEGLFDWCEGRILALEEAEGTAADFAVDFLRGLSMQLGYGCPDVVPPRNGAQRNEALEMLVRYLELHTEKAIHIRSLDVLRALFV